MTMNREELEALVIQYQNKEIEFDTLFSKSEKLIWSCCNRLYKKHKAINDPTLEWEDIKSLTYVMFYLAAKEFDSTRGAFSTLFYKKAYFAVVNEHRSHTRANRIKTFSLETNTVDDSTGHEIIGAVEGNYDVSDLTKVMHDTLKRCEFNEELNKSIIIHITTGEAMRTVAQRHGIYQTQASRALRKFREKMRQALRSGYDDK